MEEKYIDLHVHSNASDGTLTPAQVVELAAERGLAAIALTDHDTIGGIEEAVEAARNCGIQLIPGIEFSTSYQGKDIHILGLDIRIHQPGFTEALQQFLDSRDLRNRKMIELLAQHGVSITRQSMEERFPDSVWTRAHFARYLMEDGHVASIAEAFSRYLGDGCPCFVPREKVTPQQALQLIHQGGGLAVLAHPILYHLSDQQLDALVRTLKRAGLDGIEAIYTTYTESDERKIRHLARQYGLKLSGGSDFHGDNKPDIQIGTGFGNLRIPYLLLEQLRK